MSEQPFQKDGEIQLTKEVAFRPADDNDTDFARGVHHEAYRDVVVRQFGKWDETKQDEFFKKTWENPGYEIISYEGEPCGYSRIEQLPEEIKAHELVMLPEYQGRGIGTAILGKLKSRAAREGIPAHLQVLKVNKAAELYEREGFREVGETDTHKEMEWRPPIATPERSEI